MLFLFFEFSFVRWESRVTVWVHCFRICRGAASAGCVLCILITLQLHTILRCLTPRHCTAGDCVVTALPSRELPFVS